MSNSYRIRTQVGVDKSIKVTLDQDFEFLEVLSLKLLQNEIYTRQCADYGVVIGRISINNGFGLPNCRVSIFVPLSSQDATNPIISELYPYRTLSDLNDVGYRYNLLPYTKSYSAHVPTGSFFDKEDVLINQSYIEVFDKYYRYTAITNDSGDFMIFGVPLGVQTIHVDVDLSDIGEFSLAPQDLIRTGLATESQVSGTRFKSSSNLNELPQIISINRIINVEPLWGQPEICEIGINRTDFDLSAESNVVIEPTAIFMGSIFSDTDNLALRSDCKPKLYQGELCSLQAGPGEILAIRQTIDNDAQGRPILEQFELESGGQVIDDNGTWLLDLPMNLDYVTTNEFGERVISNDPEVGIPTRGKYRFKIKWNQSPKLDENVKRGYFLVPNVREYGWQNGSSIDPLTSLFALPSNTELAKKSYAFSLSWDDYADPQTAINCEDTFYQFSYNKVYTISQLIDQYRKGILSNRILGIKNILDPACESENNKFPTNDSFFRWDFIFLLFTIFGYVMRPILLALVVVLHVLFVVLDILKVVLPLIAGYLTTLGGIAIAEAVSVAPSFALMFPIIVRATVFFLAGAGIVVATILLFRVKLKGINLPLLLYDQCEFCSCSDGGDLEGSLSSSGSGGQDSVPPAIPNVSGLQLTNFEGGLYDADRFSDYNFLIFFNKLATGTYIQYSPNQTLCYSKTPFYVIGPYNDCGTICNFDYQGVACLDPNAPTKNSFFFTTSLTIAEKINLFNAKAKYFDEPRNNPVGCNNSNNPGGGVNRIKVSIEPAFNGTRHHFDNVVCVLMTPDSLSNLQAGTILTFVDPTTTNDINCTGATLNQFENNAITGTSMTPLGATTKQIQISYANWDSASPSTTLSQTYTIPAPNTGDTNFHKFPTDIEYFQVITAMTINQFNSTTLQNQTYPPPSPYSLKNRFIFGETMYGVLYDRNRFQHVNHFSKPIETLENGTEQIIVFLNRGVDPYSSRVRIKFGLGILFGYPSGQEDVVSVEADYKLNIPIQGDFLNVNHNTLPITTPNVRNAKGFDSYSNMYLYYNSFDYLPNPNQYTSFTSNLVSYYSSLSNINILRSNPNDGCSSDSFGSCILNQASPNNSYGVKVRGVNGISGNYYTTLYIQSANDRCLKRRSNYPSTIFNAAQPFNSGYFPNEIVEGVSLMSSKFNDLREDVAFQPSNRYVFRSNFDYAENFPIDDITSINWFQIASYFAPKYDSNLNLDYPLGNNNNQIVMRSDRLPTSDRLLFSCNNYYSLQQNQNLGIYIIPDEGTLGLTTAPTFGVGPLVETGFTGNSIAALLNSTNNCKDSRNLECYDFTPNGLLRDGLTRPGGGTYYTNSGFCQKFADKFIFENGCYKLITTPLISLPKDLLLVSEWFSRLNITFGACRNVFSHLFVSNWVNGGLYAFAFKNNRVLDGNGQFTSEICNDVVFFDSDTNNFFYRSSPFNTGTTLNPTQEFIGKRADLILGVPIDKNLLYPTTIMDLGPRNDYIQELIYSDEYDGYVVNNIGTTTYKDVSDLLNLLILTRLANTSFVSLMIGAQGASIFNYFTRVGLFSPRQRRFVDADYAQTISVNSELGVIGFEPQSYENIDISQSYVLGPPPPQAFAINPVYFNTGKGEDVVFGIFYSSDTQIRDFITPKRTIINGQVLANNSCAFNNFYCYSQEVPLYQWKINQNKFVENDSIFGSQTNDWYTSPISNGFLKSKYQSLDRANITSRYFRTNDASSFYVENDKGYIFSKDTKNWDETPIPPPTTDSIFWTPDSFNPLPSGQDPNNIPPNSDPRTITVGAPFYFYFGLKKGKSAWDRFAKKWINFENIN
jgi:hypothetical protein